MAQPHRGIRPATNAELRFREAGAAAGELEPRRRDAEEARYLASVIGYPLLLVYLTLGPQTAPDK